MSIPYHQPGAKFVINLAISSLPCHEYYTYMLLNRELEERDKGGWVIIKAV
jgi:hypothetical protein